MFPRPTNASFIDTTLNGYEFQTLVDTGNLSSSNLIDYKTIEGAYRHGRRRPPIRRLPGSIRAAGGAELDVIGTIQTEFFFGDMDRPWITESVIVKNLGVPAILSVNGMHDMSVVLDLAQHVASIGPYGHRVRLKPLMGPDGQPDLGPDLHNVSSKRVYVMNEKQNGSAAYAIKGGILPPNTFTLMPVSAPNLLEENQKVYFHENRSVLSQKKLLSHDTVATVHRRHNKNAFLIPVINPTNQYRKIQPGKKLGTCTIYDKRRLDCNTNSFSPVRPKSNVFYTTAKRESSASCTRRKSERCTSPFPFSLVTNGNGNVFYVKPDSKALQSPLKLPSIPPLNTLKTTQDIKDALSLFLGNRAVKERTDSQYIYNHIKELTNNQIDENKDLSKQEKEQLYFLLAQFYDIISKSQYDVGRTDLIEFIVDTGDHKPVKHKTRPLNPSMIQVLQKHLAEQIKEGIIAPGDGPWASPLVPVRKASGDWRFAVDYRELNSRTITDSYPIAHHLMATASEEFRKAKYFISIDLAGAYLAVPVEEKSQDKLAMTTCEGLFKCLRMPFGAKNACGCYARLMRIIFNDMLVRKEVMSFFDDNLIPCPTFKDGLFRLAKFLYAIRKANLRISPSKSRFFVQKVEWLGIEATAGYLIPADKHIEKVRKWPVPKAPGEISSFLGLAGYHRKFIKDFAKISRPLSQMANKDDKDFEWTKSCQESFEKLKTLLTNKPY